MGSVLLRVDEGGYGHGMGDAFWQNPIGCKPKGGDQMCMMGGCGVFSRDLKFI